IAYDSWYVSRVPYRLIELHLNWFTIGSHDMATHTSDSYAICRTSLGRRTIAASWPCIPAGDRPPDGRQPDGGQQMGQEAGAAVRRARQFETPLHSWPSSAPDRGPGAARPDVARTRSPEGWLCDGSLDPPAHPCVDSRRVRCGLSCPLSYPPPAGAGLESPRAGRLCPRTG